MSKDPPVQVFSFKMPDEGILMGGGSRVLGMDRRGQRLELYNKPSYGYGTEAALMYYSLPMLVSSERFGLIFDNGAKGVLDIGATDPASLHFEAEGGRASYIVTVAEDWPGLMEALTAVTGRQPLPPRWAFGNFSSRMGYRSQAEVEWVVDGYRVKDIPLDAVVLDLYWFGADLFGHMGNLAWDSTTFPEPESMMQSLADKGISTILITEPFILETSKRFEDVVENQLLGTDAEGAPYIYDFYFGTTGLLDIFKEDTRDWFWEIYRDFTASGVQGWWGDLGEPEVHPEGMHHTIGTANEVHNLYGHEWARLVYEGFAEDFPKQRPLILMRAGFVGSQRYGMIPWSGDVSRSWEGLQPQVEIALQMGLQGLGYMHSDLGGFAGDTFDADLYARWMQFGTFQPVYRPHAQEAVPPEPIFWDTDTLARIRPFIQLRYALAPYNYTLAYENSTTGMPFMRPLFFADDNPDLLHRADGFLWGDAFLVYPVRFAEQESVNVTFPAGAAWYDYFTGIRYEGGTEVEVTTTPETLPVFVRAGSWVPMIPPVDSLHFYPNDYLKLHYWHDETIRESSGFLYEDDGITPDAAARGLCEKTTFTTRFDAQKQVLNLSLQRDGGRFSGRADQRRIDWTVHHFPSRPERVVRMPEVTPLPYEWDLESGILTFTTTVEDGSDAISIHY
jgi:oligosaccharide 4-alpha-D-glucosyltransferase